MNESFHKLAPADQSQPVAESLREFFASRMQHTADVKFFTSTPEEQQKNLERLTRLTSLFEESGVLAHYDKCRACHPVTGFPSPASSQSPCAQPARHRQEIQQHERQQQ